MNRPFSILALVLALAASVAASADQGSTSRGIVFVSVRPDHEGEEIYMIDPETGEERRLTYSGHGKNSSIPQWSPDGTLIAFASNREDDAGRSSIYVMDCDGAKVRRLTPVGSRDYFPHWSPDGAKIAFMRSLDGDGEIYVMDSDGTNVQRLTDNDVFDAAYSWSPDGELVFTSERDGTGAVYVMDADGGNVRRIGPGFGGGWEDDGDHLWYMDYPASASNGVPCYGRMDLEGRVVERWCGKGVYPSIRHSMCYSPDKSRVAFVAIPDGTVSFPVTEEEMNRAEVFMADADGSNVHRLTTNDYYDGHCTW